MASSQAIDTVRSIQKEYVRHVRSFYGSMIDDFLAAGSPWQEYGVERMRRAIDVAAVQLPYRGFPVPPEIHRLLEFVSATREFWMRYSTPLADALRAAELFAIGGGRHLADTSLAAKQLLYFDSLFLPDSTFHGDAMDFLSTAPFSGLTNVITQALIVGAFERAVFSNTDYPLVVFYPEHFLDDDPTNPEHRPSHLEGRDASFQYCEDVFGIRLSPERFKLMPWDNSEKVSIKPDADQLKRFIPPILKTADKDPAFIGMEFPKNLYQHAMTGTISQNELRYILICVATEHHMISIAAANADRFSFDPAYGAHNFFLHELASKRSAKEWEKHVPLGESELAAYTFQTEFKWLNLSISDAIKLREADVSQEMRRCLRVSRLALKRAKVEGFSEAAKTFEAEVKKHVSEGAAQNTRAVEESRRKLGLSAVSFAGSAVLAVASAAFPPLAPAALISTIVGLAVGGSSLRDVVNAHLTGRRKRSELRQRPVAFLAESLQKNEPR